MLNRVEIKQRAKGLIFENYGQKAALSVVYFLAIFLAGLVQRPEHYRGDTMAFLVQILLLSPLLIGVLWGYLKAWRGWDIQVQEDLKSGFTPYGRNVASMLLMEIFIILWTLLLIIPGIIKSVAYSMTPYLLAEHKNISARDAIRISNEITRGYKGDLFIAMLSFIGWWLLSALTLGLLAIFYVFPYYSLTFAGFYEDLKQRALDRGVITLEDLGESEYIPPFEYHGGADEPKDETEE